MTKLEAVNIMIQGTGVPPVTALDTGGTSDAGEAEAMLDMEIKDIADEREWWCIYEDDVTLSLPDTRIDVTGGSGTFVFGETVTQATSLATGVFKYILSGQMYLVATSGTFTTGILTLTGGTSGATRTGSNYVAITEARHAIDSDWYNIRPAEVEWKRLAPRGGYLYDPEDNTFNFTEDVRIHYTEPLTFSDLPHSLANYIARSAAVKYQRYKKRSQVDDQMLLQQAEQARRRALVEHNRNKGVSMFEGYDHQRIRGFRYNHHPEIG